MKTAYKFRLYPNKQQETQLSLTLDTCRHLWNRALADRKNAWEHEGITRSYEDQAALLVYPKYYVQAEMKNRAANKSLHRKKLGSNNRKKAQTKLARIAKRVTNLRENFLHQVSRKLVNSADRIVFEDLSIPNMLKNHSLAKYIQDVSWGKLIRFTVSKAERAGKTVVLVNPYNTSQRCSACGEIVSKKLKDRVHTCYRCGLIICRDLNASMVIRTLGLRGIARGELTCGFGLCPK